MRDPKVKTALLFYVMAKNDINKNSFIDKFGIKYTVHVQDPSNSKGLHLKDFLKSFLGDQHSLFLRRKEQLALGISISQDFIVIQLYFYANLSLLCHSPTVYS